MEMEDVSLPHLSLSPSRRERVRCILQIHHRLSLWFDRSKKKRVINKKKKQTGPTDLPDVKKILKVSG